MLIAMIQAAATVAVPAINTAIQEFQVVGHDVSAHKSALQTFQDALAQLAVVMAAPPPKLAA
jgi:hypothetical protein